MKERRGFTLIELLIVISLLAVILPLTGKVIHLLLQAQAATSDSLTDALTLSRFSQTFRNDAHTAENAELKPAENAQSAIVLRLGSGRTVVYTVDLTGQVTRTIDNHRSTERREQFRLRRLQVHFEIATNGREVAAILQSAAPADGSAARNTSPLTIRVAAVVSRDRQLEAAIKSRPPRPKPSAAAVAPADAEKKRP